MTLILGCFFLLYILLVTVFIWGWKVAVRHSETFVDTPIQDFHISVVIAARNEQETIGMLLRDLSRQRFKNFNVIVVNDHSEDKTADVVLDFAKNDARFCMINNDGNGKKQALSKGVGEAKGSIIVMTDADCRVTEDWLVGLSKPFHNEETMMVFGAVKMDGKSFFARLQAVEFLSVLASGLAMAGIGFPIMCNGANIAFRKSAFTLVGGYTGNLHIPSGDDEFLMRKILQKHPKGVKMLVTRETVVSTLANQNLHQLIQQRIRWAGKWKSNSSLLSKVMAFFIFCFQMLVVLLPVLVLMHAVSLITVLVLWFMKVLVELIFLRTTSRYLGVSWNWAAFLVLQVFYPWYVLGVGLLSNFLSFEWKGRKLKSLTISSK